jgi:hypothetical protein
MMLIYIDYIGKVYRSSKRILKHISFVVELNYRINLYTCMYKNVKFAGLMWTLETQTYN